MIWVVCCCLFPVACSGRDPRHSWQWSAGLMRSSCVGIWLLSLSIVLAADLLNLAGLSIHTLNLLVVLENCCIISLIVFALMSAIPLLSGHNETVLAKGSALCLMYNPAFFSCSPDLCLMRSTFSCSNPWLLFPFTSVSTSLFGILHMHVSHSFTSVISSARVSPPGVFFCFDCLFLTLLLGFL